MTCFVLILCAALHLVGSIVAAAEPRIVFLVSEPEYETEVTLPAFAEEHLEPLGYRSEFVFSSQEDPNRFEDLEKLEAADVIVLSVRRRTPPVEQMEMIKRVVNSEVGLVGIRTSSHPFHVKNKTPPEGHGEWPGFDAQVWGGSYTNHHPAGPVSTITFADGATKHPVMAQIHPGEFTSAGSLYMVGPVASDATLLLFGESEGKPKEPVAWVRTRGEQRVFYTSLGSKGDFQNDVFEKMLVNAIGWAGRLEEE